MLEMQRLPELLKAEVGENRKIKGNSISNECKEQAWVLPSGSQINHILSFTKGHISII